MKSQDSKSVMTTQQEKPVHYSYLKEFRVEQCPLFLQHKCTQHRPYTCFHWHFQNQRRRRPIRRKDGSLNYSPDIYCTKYDENTGKCPDGDDCPFLHRTAGDTERRYHLRYYKTGMCVHDTDARGYCVKNGAHCAFAHGIEDVRPPVFDLREGQQGIDVGLTAEGMQQLLQEAGAIVNGSVTPAPGVNGGLVPNSLDKERNMVNDDPKWQDTAHVLANYKTEQCKRPPRLCRQGYACPQYHNSRDRRRPPKKYKYRSTACPNVKHSDEWGEPSNCENGDACQYCHTRTEQQFHPEIYKSTKCNDIQQTNYCPRGVFCAFAHVDQEMSAVRETAANENCAGHSLADILQSALKPDPSLSTLSGQANNDDKSSQSCIGSNTVMNCSVTLPDAHISNGFISPPVISTGGGNGIAPIGSGKARHFSGNASNSGLLVGNNPLPVTKEQPGMFLINSAPIQPPPSISSYLKAPGSERENDSNLKKQLTVKDLSDARGLDALESLKRKPSGGSSGCSVSNSLFIGSVGIASNVTNSSVLTNGTLGNSTFVHSLSNPIEMTSIPTSVSPLAPPYYPTSNTVESVVGNALDDINLSELSVALDKDFNTMNSISSSLNTALASSGLIGSSTPVTIPGSSGTGVNGVGSFSDRACNSILSGLASAVTTQGLHSSSPSNVFNPHHSFLHSTGGVRNVLEHGNNLAVAFLRATTNGSSAATQTAQPTSLSATVNTPQQLTSTSHLFESVNTTASNLFSSFPSNTISAGLSSTLNSTGVPNSNLSNNIVSNLTGAGLTGMSPHQNTVLSQSPLLFHPSDNNSASSANEVWRLRDELLSNRAKLASWEEGIAQARTACEAWRREVDEAHRKIKLVEQAKEELAAKLSAVQQELETCRAGKQVSPYVQVLNAHIDLENLPRHILQQLSSKLRTDAQAVDKALSNTALTNDWSNVPNW